MREGISDSQQGLTIEVGLCFFMSTSSLLNGILAELQNDKVNVVKLEDCFTVIQAVERTDFEYAHKANEVLRAYIGQAVKRCKGNNALKAFALYKKSLLFDAPYNFDSFLLYIEINREPRTRFYQPRRKVLKKVVDALQALADDELDELFISMPPRVGKTTILMFFVLWLIGRDPEKANLYSAYSAFITSAFYNGVIEVIKDPLTYLWGEVFPNRHIVSTNNKECTLNIDRRKRYPSLTSRSVEGTLNGACDCNGIMIIDDIVEGIEEALNRDRLWSKWLKVDNNLLPRAKESAKILWVGTRWSVNDPAGVRMELLLNDPTFKDRRFKIINLPALNSNNESNFEYDYGVGFSTKHYLKRRASFERQGDMASWLAQFMCQPIEREGSVFKPDELRYFNGNLPDGEPDRKFMTVDPAFGGGDYVAAPVCYMYGEDIYVVSAVFDKRDKKVTQAILASRIAEYEIDAVQLEVTRTTESYKEGVQKALEKVGYKTNLTSRGAPTTISKVTRILDKAPEIREHMIFLESGCRPKEYELFMQNVFAFKEFGKNKNDDAPDSLAQAMKFIEDKSRKFKIIKRFI